LRTHRPLSSDERPAQLPRRDVSPVPDIKPASESADGAACARATCGPSRFYTCARYGQRNRKGEGGLERVPGAKGDPLWLRPGRAGRHLDCARLGFPRTSAAGRQLPSRASNRVYGCLAIKLSPPCSAAAQFQKNRSRIEGSFSSARSSPKGNQVRCVAHTLRQVRRRHRMAPGRANGECERVKHAGLLDPAPGRI
jgi:hypothetical protein